MRLLTASRRHVNPSAAPSKDASPSRTIGSLRAGWLSLLTIATVLAGVLTAPLMAQADTSPVDAGTPLTVAADALPTTQINGVVWSQVIVGNTVYAGGEFTKARPAGSAAGVNEVVRNNLLAYNLTTGVLVASFNPDLNGVVRTLAASADGTRLYAGGFFTTVGGVARYRLAAFDTASGALVSNWAPTVNASVKTLATFGDTVYVGGVFTSASGVARNQTAAFATSNGAIRAWTGEPVGGSVNTMAISPDGTKVLIGGSFTSYNNADTPGYGMAATDSVTGASLPWAVNALIRNGGVNGAITSLSSSADGAFGTGYDYGSGANFEGTFRANWSDGTLVWMEDCHGDTYSAVPFGNVVYTTGHTHYCGNMGGPVETTPRSYHRTLTFSMAATGTLTPNAVGSYVSFTGKPSPSILTFYPEINSGTFTGQGQGPWTITGNGQYLLYGGEFTNVNNKGQQGLVRFASTTIAPNKEGPRVANAAFAAASFVPTVDSLSAGTARIGWKAAFDRDNERLSYEVLRDGVSVGTVTGLSTDWSRPPMGFTDTGLTPGQTYAYRVRVQDSFGNVKTGNPTSVTVSGSGDYSAYATTVKSDSPSSYWPLGEPSGTTAFDWAAASNETTGTGVIRDVAGALAADSDTASRFSGTTAGTAASSAFETPRGAFTVEAWVKTTTRRGGKIIGLGNAATGASTSYDRQVYMDNAGRLWFGVKPGILRTVNTTAAYNDGQWHHIVASVGTAGMSLYVDGALAAQRTDTTTAAPGQGYWRIGGDNLSGWTSRPFSDYIAADIDEVAVYNTVLSASAIARHNSIGRFGPPANVAPTASFSSAITYRDLSVDATGSMDSDGTITSYAWNFGDDTTATGATATHSYATAGSYPVTLTVTDNSGASTVTSRTIDATDPPANVPPTAAFSYQATPLTIATDASASADSDGTITGYSWDFGDGSIGTGVTASHSYAVSGSYDVTLTVTDNSTATAQTMQTVVVPAVDPNTPLATDAFSRTLATGLGAADTGGAWTTTGTASNYSVSGGAGRLKAAAGATANAYLSGVSLLDTDMLVTTTLQQDATGSGAYTSLIGRRVGTDDYRVRMKNLATGVVQLQLMHGATTLKAQNVAGLTYTTGNALQLRVQVIGSAPTTIRAKVWALGTPEPSAWQTTVTDSTAAMQTPGAVGLAFYLGSTATVTPVTATFDDLFVTRAN
ncbi:PKD domain-containing protein [Cryobacterium sp. TMT1-2-2]|uniref:PKD domain-containing protein n=1 Tax=Cryobacterium sp. TMT1-2-2 TaxID=1259233 RepID=UPI00106C3D89|nr:PKD domain-containing protein [Cryobacterium sp. TMT1-2-2]TFD12071.1 PKD domain-containing protein [Cryobacterium sp. TMT1-2-2]